MAAATLRASPDMANGNSNQQNTNESHQGPDYGVSYDESGYEPPVPEGQYKRSGNRQSGQPGRSFSARARDRPPANMNYTTRKPVPDNTTEAVDESTTPRGLPPVGYPPGPDVTAQENEEPASSPRPSAPSRTNTTHSSSDQRRDWATDRSPLQKLEVTLTGISKEEKRARVQEAEMRLRERLARQQVERQRGEAAAPATSRPGSEQSTRSESKSVAGSGRKGPRKEIVLEGTTRDIPPATTRQPEGTAVRHNRNASMNPQYPAVRRPEDPRYAQADAALPPSIKTGNAPRRSVTVGGPSAKPGPAGENMKHSRTVSHHGPPKPFQPAPVVAAAAAAAPSADRLDTPPVAQAAQASVESHTKPKKHSVSFNVPPPTPPPIFEWKNAPIARLGATDFDFQHLHMDRSKAWWEGGGTNNRRKSRALPKNYQTPAQKLTGKNCGLGSIRNQELT